MTERISKDIMAYYQRPKSYRVSQFDREENKKKKKGKKSSKPSSIYDIRNLMSPIERKAIEKSKAGVLIGGGLSGRHPEDIDIDEYFVKKSERVEEKRKNKYLREEARREELRLEKEKREAALRQMLTSSNVK